MLLCVADDHSLSILMAHGLPWPGSHVGAGECQPHVEPAVPYRVTL